MSEIYYLNVADVEFIALELAHKLFQTQEEIPPFNTRFLGKLESCLEMPKQSFSGNEIYPHIFEKAAALFCFITKNHPFVNGNKRMAVAIMLVFLTVNDKYVRFTPIELYELAKEIASSKEEINNLITRLASRIESTAFDINLTKLLQEIPSH